MTGPVGHHVVASNHHGGATGIADIRSRPQFAAFWQARIWTQAQRPQTLALKPCMEIARQSVAMVRITCWMTFFPYPKIY